MIASRGRWTWSAGHLPGRHAAARWHRLPFPGRAGTSGRGRPGALPRARSLFSSRGRPVSSRGRAGGCSRFRRDSPPCSGRARRRSPSAGWRRRGRRAPGSGSSSGFDLLVLRFRLPLSAASSDFLRASDFLRRFRGASSEVSSSGVVFFAGARSVTNIRTRPITTAIAVVAAMTGKLLIRGLTTARALLARPAPSPSPVSRTTSGITTASTSGGCTMGPKTLRRRTSPTARVQETRKQPL